MLHSYEVTGNSAHAALFDRVVEGLDLPPALPVMVIGDTATVGHGRRTEAEIRLVGGVVMLGLGLALIFRPNWLAFAIS